jgi:hypothetical protein
MDRHEDCRQCCNGITRTTLAAISVALFAVSSRQKSATSSLSTKLKPADDAAMETQLMMQPLPVYSPFDK